MSSPPEPPPKKKLVLPFQVQFDNDRKQRRPYERNPAEEMGPPLVTEKVEINRACLRCDKPFVAPSLYIRLCQNCGKWASLVHTPQFEGW